MKILQFILKQKESFKSQKIYLKNDYLTAQKLGFQTELLKIDRDINHVIQIIDLLDDILSEIQKEKTFTESEISQLQDSVYKTTGDGEVMKLFNSLLGINLGGGS